MEEDEALLLENEGVGLEDEEVNVTCNGHASGICPRNPDAGN